MRRFLLLFIFLMFISLANAIEIDLPGSFINRTASAGNPNVEIIGLKYEPFPVEPGEKFDLWLRIKNLGDRDVQDVKIQLVETGTFSAAGKTTFELSGIPRNQEAVIKFEDIKVDEGAVEGINQLEFIISLGRPYEETYRVQKLDIEIRTVSPVLFIEVETIPEKIPQGKIGEISLTITNLDESLLEDISIKLNLPDEIVPIGSTTEAKISRLSPLEKKSLVFQVTPLADADAKAYKVDLNISYFDEIGNSFNKIDQIGILVGSSVEYDLNIEDGDNIVKGSNNKVTISVSNVGPDEIKFLTIEILDSSNYEVLGTKKSYLGNLESDDFETAQFDVYVKKKGKVPVKVRLSYKDSFNEDFEVVEELSLRAYSGRELSKFGLVEKRDLTKIIIYIIIIIFIYLTYNNWRKERDIAKSIKISAKTMLHWFVRQIKKINWRNIKRLPRKIRMFFRDV